MFVTKKSHKKTHLTWACNNLGFVHATCFMPVTETL